MKLGKEPTLAVVTVTVALSALMPAFGQTTAQSHTSRVASSSASKGMAAIDQAARNSKYLFVFFWKTNDDQTQRMLGVFETAKQGMAEVAATAAIQITNPTERPIVDKFGVSRAPMPLVLAIAPNGAVTRGFPIKFTEEKLREAIVSPCTAQCLKALQDRKLVLLCVQNEKTEFSQAAWQGVQAFKADTRFTKATEVVSLNPADRNEASFLNMLKVDPQTPHAVTLLMAPPGTTLAQFSGPVTKDEIVTTIASAQSVCGPGGSCGPGGCGPKR